MENYIQTNLLPWSSGKIKGFNGKNLIDLQNGGFKMIKIDAFASYPVHVHPDKTEFAFVLEGNPTMIIGEENYCGEKGDFFVFPSTIKHQIANPTDSNCLLLVGSISN